MLDPYWQNSFRRPSATVAKNRQQRIPWLEAIARQRTRTVPVDRVSDLTRPIRDLQRHRRTDFKIRPVDAVVGIAGHAKDAHALEDDDLARRDVGRRWRFHDRDRIGCALAAAKGDREGFALDRVGASVPVAPR